MYGSRNGSDGTADCSGSMTQAIRDAGADPYSYLYNTDSLHGYLWANGYYLVTANGNFTPERGDWGRQGESGGAAGHTLVISQGGNDAQCISTCPVTIQTVNQEQRFKNWYWHLDDWPFYYVYRQDDQHRN